MVSQIPQMAKVVSWVKAHYYSNVTDNKTLRHEFERMRKASRICVAMFKWVWFQVMNFEQQMSPLHQLGALNVNNQQLSK